MYILYKVHGVHYEYVGMSLVFSRSTKKIVGMQRQARRAVFIAVRLFDTDKKATKLNRARIFTESQVCFSIPHMCCTYVYTRLSLPSLKYTEVARLLTCLHLSTSGDPAFDFTHGHSLTTTRY